MLSPLLIEVYDPIFNQKVHVFCNSTEQDLLRWQKRVGVRDDDNEGLNPNYIAFSTHYSSTGGPNIYLIWLNHFNWTLDDQESLIHEVTHIVVRIWQANNIQFVPETQEFFAHSIGRLYSMIATKILARKVGKRKRTSKAKSK